MLARLQKSMKEKDQGFTLIELLVVIVIIGILAAIAIPLFLSQREKGVEAGIKSDLKTIATVQETYFVDAGAYAADEATLTDFTPTDGNVITVVTAAVGGFCVNGSNPNVDTGAIVWHYDSADGGLAAGSC